MDAARSLIGKHVVVTGFTGFVAKVVVAMLLEQVPGIGRISLLVRPRGRVRPAIVRVERAIDTSPVFRRLRQTRGADLADWLAPRIDAIDADVEQPLCGLAEDALARLASADVILHCAGLTDFEPDPRAALLANVAGALHVADLAARLGAPMVHVSTCFVAGATGEAVVEERLDLGRAPNGATFDVEAEIRAFQQECRRTTDPSARLASGLARARALGWPNLYTYTKGLAEHALTRRLAGQVTLVRPAIVECAREFPFPGWNEGLNTAGPLAWLISTAFRRLPTVPDHHFDVVPVDDVAKGLIAITALAIDGRAGGVFHLASSDHNPLSFERAVELTGLGMRRWTRKGHGTVTDRALFRWLDPIPVAADAPGPFSLPRLREWAGRAREWARSAEEALPDKLREALDAEKLRRRVEAEADRADDVIGRIEQMLALYRPFIHDNDWVFRTDRARAATADDPQFRFDLRDLDWCAYWVDIEYPGLRQWCIPLIDGEKVPSDPPSVPPLRLARADDAERMASK